MKQVILDTNIFLRLLVKTHHDQFCKSEEIFGQIQNKKLKGLVSILVINEIIWVLIRVYKLQKSEFLPEILQLLALKNLLVIEQKKADTVNLLESIQDRNIDFTDLYLVSIAGKKEILTFDKDFEKLKQ